MHFTLLVAQFDLVDDVRELVVAIWKVAFVFLLLLLGFVTHNSLIWVPIAPASSPVIIFVLRLSQISVVLVLLFLPCLFTLILLNPVLEESLEFGASGWVASPSIGHVLLDEELSFLPAQVPQTVPVVPIFLTSLESVVVSLTLEMPDEVICVDAEAPIVPVPVTVVADVIFRPVRQLLIVNALTLKPDFPQDTTYTA